MTCKFFTLPLAAVLALSLSGCGRDKDPVSAPSNPQLPRPEQSPPSSDLPAAGKPMNPDTKDPSIPNNPANKEPAKKDSSPPNGTGDPKKDKPEG